ncbi:MAG: cobalamin-dependent protein [Deltaproteobacteria bacterium]|nr:cobalamin-dependent protein [Deltaproteobacteria bacterium]
MRVTFLALGCEQLALSQLSALARREGHDVGLAFSAALFDDRYFLRAPRLAAALDDRAEALAAIVAQRPDVLACSVLTNTYRWMLELARAAKERLPGLRVVFGGVHPSAVADRVLEHDAVDYVCVGEGDVAFPALLRALEGGGPHGALPNLRYRDGEGRTVAGPQLPFFADLDSLPHFDKTLWEEHLRVADPYLTVASRGCPYRCTFCFNNFFVELPDGDGGRYVRQRGVAHVLDELGAARARYGGLGLVNFQDDVFTVDREWLAPFLERYRREIGALFRCMSHPRYVDDEIASWLAPAGCVGVQIGVQSIDDGFKHDLKRYERTHHVARAIEALEGRGVPVQVDHILGLPGEPDDAQDRARVFYARHAPTRISIYWATYFPGTEMIQQGLAARRLTPADVDAIEDGDLAAYHDSAAASGGDEAAARCCAATTSCSGSSRGCRGRCARASTRAGSRAGPARWSLRWPSRRSPPAWFAAPGARSAPTSVTTPRHSRARRPAVSGSCHPPPPVSRIRRGRRPSPTRPSS